jgi:tetratricopeptide (TPR) repeat protein
MNGAGVSAGGRLRPPDVYIGLFLALITLITFLPVLDHPFLRYDDPGYVTDNPHVRDGLSTRGVLWALTTDAEGNWHPLTWLSHMLDGTVFGPDPRGHHLTSLVLHLANVLLLFVFLRGASGAPFLSGFAAALFAVHPLRVESVAWIAERKDVLSTLFLMLALLAYLRYVRRPGAGRYGVLLLLFALGLTAKPMLVTLPFLLLLLDFWPLNRVPAEGAARRRLTPDFPRLERATWKRLVLEKLPLLAISAASSWATLAALRGGQAVKSVEQMPAAARLANAALAYAGYVGKMLWPDDLAFFYPYPAEISLWKLGLAVVVLAAISVAAVRFARTLPYLFTGWFWYAGMLVPVIGLVQVGASAMADRYTYVPLVGLFVALTWGSDDLLSGWRRRALAVVPVAALVLLALVLASRAQLKHWSSSSALYAHALEVTEGNYAAHDLLGAEEFRQGRSEAAIRHYREALRAAPTYAVAHNNLGIALAAQGRFEEAIRHFRAALQSNDDNAEAQKNLGLALFNLRQIDEALEHLETALRLEPGDPEIHHHLGNLWLSQGDAERALQFYREALRLAPEWRSVAVAVAWILSTHPDPALRDGEEAVRLAEGVCRAGGYQEPRRLDALAAALAEAGRFEEANHMARRAIALARERGDDLLAAGINARAELYRAGQPYRDDPG